MGEVVPARTSPTLLPPSPRTVLSLSCFKVLQCINCRDWHLIVCIFLHVASSTPCTQIPHATTHDQTEHNKLYNNFALYENKTFDLSLWLKDNDTDTNSRIDESN